MDNIQNSNSEKLEETSEIKSETNKINAKEKSEEVTAKDKNDKKHGRLTEEKKKKINVALKIISAATYLVVTVFVAVMFADVLAAETQEVKATRLFFFLIIHVSMFGAGYIVTLISSIAGLIASVKNLKNDEGYKRSVVYYSIFIILPVITWAGVIIACKFI